MDRPNDISATSLLQALLLPGFYEVLNRANDADFEDYHALRDQLEEQQGAFIEEAAPAIEAALNRYIDRQLAVPMVPAVRGEDYDPRVLAAIFLDPATTEDDFDHASLRTDRAGYDVEPDTIGAAPNLLTEYCYLLGGNDRAEALALLAVLVGDFDAWRQALAGEDLDTLQRDLRAEAEGVRIRYPVTVKVPNGYWDKYQQRATLDVETSTVIAEGITVAEAIRSCQLGAPLLDFESPELWGGPAPVRQVAPARGAGGDPFAGLSYFGDAKKAELAETYADEIADPLWHDIPLLTAQRAHEGTSMVPERRAVSEVARYVQHLQAVRDNLESQAKTDEQQEIAAAEFERYRQGYRQRIIESLGQRSRVLSAMITGPSKFPTSSNRKRSNAYENGINELVEWSERAQKAAAKAIRGRFEEGGPISSDDPEALTKLKAEIEHLRKVQAAMVATNKIVRDAKLDRDQKIAKMIAAGLNTRNATSVLTPDFAGRLGFPAYALSNNSANIRRLEGRVEQLTRLRAQPGGEVELSVEGIGDVTVEDNVEDNRLRLHFPGKPSYEVREKLKSNGFKWAPSEGAWQRFRGSGAIYAAQEILGVRNLSALLAASAETEPEVEDDEKVEVIPVPAGEPLPADVAAEELEAIAEPEPAPISVTAYEFSQMQSDEDKRAGAADLMRQLSPRRQPVPEPEPAPRKLSIEEDRKRAKMLVKIFPPIDVVFESVPPALALDGSVIRPGFSGWKLAGTTGNTLAATREEVEQRAAERRETEMTEENRRLLALSTDGFNSERERLLGFGEVVSDYLDTATSAANREKLLAQLSEPEMQREGRKKTDKTFQGTRAEVVDQMLKAGYFPIVQRPPGGSKEVPLLKNWQGVFEVKPEVYAFAEWLQERRKRDERALELDGARESARWEAQQARQSNPRRRSNPDIGTSMIYGYGINQMTPSAPMGGRTANGAAASVRQARLAAEAERLAQRLARGRR